MRAVTRGGDKTTPALNAEIELTTGSRQLRGGRGARRRSVHADMQAMFYNAQNVCPL